MKTMKNKRSYRIERIDHLVLTVASIEATIAFYETVREMTPVRFGVDNQRVAVKFDEQRINLHEVGCGFEPKAGRPTAGSANLCFFADDFASVAAQLTACGIEIIERMQRCAWRHPIDIHPRSGQKSDRNVSLWSGLSR